MQLEFETDHAILQEDLLQIDGGQIPIRLEAEKDEDGAFYRVTIDNVEWFTTENTTHAIILYTMLKEHVTEYMTYKAIREG